MFFCCLKTNAKAKEVSFRLEPIMLWKLPIMLLSSTLVLKNSAYYAQDYARDLTVLLDYIRIS